MRMNFVSKYILSFWKEWDEDGNVCHTRVYTPITEEYLKHPEYLTTVAFFLPIECGAYIIGLNKT